MEIRQTPLFKRSYKKFHAPEKAIINSEIKKIIADPSIGVEKKQDLRNIYIHKFKINNQLYLLAYTYDPVTLNLIMLNVHENFYRDLKKYLY